MAFDILIIFLFGLIMGMSCMAFMIFVKKNLKREFISQNLRHSYEQKGIKKNTDNKYDKYNELQEVKYNKIDDYNGYSGNVRNIKNHVLRNPEGVNKDVKNEDKSVERRRSRYNSENTDSDLDELSEVFQKRDD